MTPVTRNSSPDCCLRRASYRHSSSQIGTFGLFTRRGGDNLRRLVNACKARFTGNLGPARIRRRFATLMELVISLGLTAMLITLLLGTYWQAQRVDIQTRASRNWIDGRQTVQIQLQRWLSPATLGVKLEPAEANKPMPYFFYTSRAPDALGQVLTWTAHTQPGVDPALSGDLLVRLYVDGDHQLCLKLWPLPTEEHLKAPLAHKMVLAPGVAQIEISMYAPPAQAHEPPKDLVTQPLQGWVTDWPMTAKQLPAMVRIQILYQNGETLPLSFHVPEGSPVVVYPKSRSRFS